MSVIKNKFYTLFNQQDELLPKKKPLRYVKLVKLANNQLVSFLENGSKEKRKKAIKTFTKVIKKLKLPSGISPETSINDSIIANTDYYNDPYLPCFYLGSLLFLDDKKNESEKHFIIIDKDLPEATIHYELISELFLYIYKKNYIKTNETLNHIKKLQIRNEFINLCSNIIENMDKWILE